MERRQGVLEGTREKGMEGTRGGMEGKVGGMEVTEWRGHKEW